jgi:hypothetical protein
MHPLARERGEGRPLGSCGTCPFFFAVSNFLKAPPRFSVQVYDLS